MCTIWTIFGWLLFNILQKMSSCLKSDVEMKKLCNAADVVSFLVWTILLSIVIYIYFFYHENWEQRDDGKIGEKT